MRDIEWWIVAPVAVLVLLLWWSIPTPPPQPRIVNHHTCTETRELRITPGTETLIVEGNTFLHGLVITVDGEAPPLLNARITNNIIYAD